MNNEEFAFYEEMKKHQSNAMALENIGVKHMAVSIDFLKKAFEKLSEAEVRLEISEDTRQCLRRILDTVEMELELYKGLPEAKVSEEMPEQLREWPEFIAGFSGLHIVNLKTGIGAEVICVDTEKGLVSIRYEGADIDLSVIEVMDLFKVVGKPLVITNDLIDKKVINKLTGTIYTVNALNIYGVHAELINQDGESILIDMDTLKSSYKVLA